MNEQLAGKPYLLGDQFSVADAYLFAVTGWAGHLGIDLSPHSNVQAWRSRVEARPAVQEALKAEAGSK